MNTSIRVANPATACARWLAAVAFAVDRECLGEEGFEGQVERVSELEKKLGIFDLAQFTPR